MTVLQVMMHQSTISAAYFNIERLMKEIFDKPPIVSAIDEATGYDKKLVSLIIENAEAIIEAKKKLELDFSKEEQLINKCNEFLK